MSYQVPNFLKREGDGLVFNQDGEFIFYVPQDYFNTNNAFLVDDYINIIGVLDYTIANKNGKNNGLHPFKFPTVFLTKPSAIEDLKQIKLIKTAPVQDYKALHYKKGDFVVISVKVPQNIQNMEDIMKLFFISGHIPPTIPYNTIQNYFPESLELNGGGSFNVDIGLFGVIIAGVCRSSKDLAIPFRLSKSNDMLDYTPVSVQNLPKLNSPFDSLISENWDRSIIGASLTKEKSTQSPLEKVLMGK